MLNGNVVMNKPLTVEEHQASRMIADPLRLFDCSLESDGGAAIVVSAADRARDLNRPLVTVMGVAEGHPESPASIAQRPDILEFGLARAAPRAFAMAGVGPKDMDVAEIYDCFTFTVINQLELLGFCRKGEGGPFVMDGRTALGGELPVNTHGGLLSQGHVVGLNHIIELTRQLRREAGKAQVKDAELGAGHRLRRHGRRLGRDPAAGGMSDAVPQRPLPMPTRESRPYWDAMKEGRFRLQHCAACGKVRHYPKPVCPHCFSMESEWRDAPLGGKVHSWTVCHHPFNFFFKQQAPYIVALVDMEAGVRVNAPAARYRRKRS